ncbi:hypothetical protein FHG87_014392 [Trinorchestia longiramus]|nr:hypothetical protein FHG87_014392 [Trinorchestia longiramus]
MESNQNTKKASKAKTKVCKECKATYSLQFFNMRGCNMEECRFCYSNHESSASIENQSLEIQELRCLLEMLAGRLETIDIQQKQNHEHELRLQTSETHHGQHLRSDNSPQRMDTVDKRSNFHQNTKNRFKALKDELENSINSTK